MRPAGKVPLWTGGLINSPGVNPPGFLRFVLILCLSSLIGTLVYGVLAILGHFPFDSMSPAEVLALMVVVFLFPFTILYTITVNSPLSRLLLTANFLASVGFLAWLQGSWFSLVSNPYLAAICTFVLFSLAWLYGSTRARVYYTLIANKPVSPKHRHIVDELVKPTASQLWFQRLGNMLEPFTAIFVFLLSALLVYAGFRGLSP